MPQFSNLLTDPNLPIDQSLVDATPGLLDPTGTTSTKTTKGVLDDALEAVQTAQQEVQITPEEPGADTTQQDKQRQRRRRRRRRERERTKYQDPTNVSPLVSEQITGLLEQDSPYMSAARERGEQVAASRGLLNTSLAGQASQQAAIEAALPIAQQDAGFAAGLESERVASELSYERSKALQDDQLALEIMNSDMTTKQKNKALEFLLGVKGVKDLAEKEVAPGKQYKPGSYKETKAAFPDFASFIIDSDARESWKKDKPVDVEGKVTTSPLTGRKINVVLNDNIKTIANKLNASVMGGDAKLIKRFVDTYGTWDNAVRAAKSWLGPNATDKEIKTLIKSTLK